MKNEVWKWFDGRFKVHCKGADDARKVLSWKGAEDGGIYHFPDRHIESDVIIPADLYNRTAELLGLPKREKSVNRVKIGKEKSQTNSKHRFLRRSFSEICPQEKV